MCNSRDRHIARLFSFPSFIGTVPALRLDRVNLVDWVGIKPTANMTYASQSAELLACCRRHCAFECSRFVVGLSHSVPLIVFVRDQERQWAPKGVDLREAIQAESIIMVEAALAGNDFRQKLMAKNAEKGAGMLMLAVSIGNVPIFLRLADIIVKRVSECGRCPGEG